ncbi:MAG: [FeFe] hydrogenase H-cluster maturation GTPase HydF [Saccharofermentans sp.]|jgi:[FeFe] hydrogenase H-cluster maturation GTPase HydF|nr:[FeFe] hydrogenase H-cluster maturation GTPase HydF [Mageeibacillus sp.]MCI1264550.1 [FeFe] hydrogenase H-cluster maturation GTPase HydF [Saccharofermentans sp.]MCI1275043.1 [FeFe] hydrogenase H-cluster maturation GTPase HydF [Saccharofermentans sp.]
MSLNDTPSGERIHIGFFGRRNAGKSSLVNRVTDQELAVVSDTKGTTTDPVTKAMELLPLGPVVIIDTPGFDDVGDLGAKRISKTRLILNRVDVAVLVVDITEGIGDCEKLLISLFDEKKIPYIIAYNKADLMQKIPSVRDNEIYVSSITGSNISELKEMIARSGSVKKDVAPLISDLIDPGDTVILVIPIDSSAPKGRIILPQQQVLREILDCNAKAMCVQHTELDSALSGLKGKAALVVTDSQVFGKIAPIVPADVRLTSFSILMARHKGFLSTAVRGAAALDRLKDGDTVLISEGCTHHRQCEDIGTVKLPAWIRQYTGKQLRFETTSGLSFADDLSRYSMIVHCGACMLNDREVLYRMASAEEIGIPMTNYGTAIAHMHGILARSLEVFPGLYEEFVNG